MVDIYSQFRDFKLFEVIFTDNNKQLQKLLCSVKSIENNSIIINANNQKNKNVSANVGDELKLHIYTDNGIYSATSRVLLVTKEFFNTEYVISYPENSKHSQRREYFRADLLLKFKLTVTTADEPSLEFLIEGMTKNICGKGMSFISDKPFPAHDKLELELYFPEKTITTAAALVYSKQIVVDNRPKFIHAFTFTNISSGNINFIVKKCFLRQLDLRRKL